MCNKKFASLIGYKTVAEFAEEESVLDANVAEKSQQTVVSAYRAATEKFEASKIVVTAKKKSGSLFEVTVIVVPLIYQGHVFALHFISEK